MPSESLAEHGAMAAAAKGQSNLGIPKKVGQEFLKADKGKKFPTKHVADAIRKKKAPAMDPETEAEMGGRYSKGGVGT